MMTESYRCFFNFLYSANLDYIIDRRGLYRKVSYFNPIDNYIQIEFTSTFLFLQYIN